MTRNGLLIGLASSFAGQLFLGTKRILAAGFGGIFY